MDIVEILQRADSLKAQIDALRPIDREQELRILQKFRLDWNYHSNALEGNTLTYGETRAFLLHGITAQGKPFRDYLDMKGHQAALEQLEEIVRPNLPLTEVDIRELHRILLVEPYEMPAVTLNGTQTTRRVTIGQYKTVSNSVRTSTGAIHFYASPEETPARMGDLMAWYRRVWDSRELHPLLIAATFHFRFVEIHPFDDGNGRMARLLMNLILMQAGYTPVIINTNTKAEYLLALETADAGELEPFVTLIGLNLIQSLQLFLRGAQGQQIDELSDLDKRVHMLQKRLATYESSEDTIDPIVRQHALAESFIAPLILTTIEQLSKVYPLFESISGQILVKTNDSWQTTSLPAYDAIDHLVSILSSDEYVHEIKFSQDLQHLRGEPTINISFTVTFRFVKTFISIQDIAHIESNTRRFPNGDLFANGNVREFPQSEIDSLVYPMIASLVIHIEKLEKFLASEGKD